MSALAKSSLKFLNHNNRPQSQRQSTEQQRTFTCFPKLPVEIRFKIWKLLVPEPRNIDVGVKYESRWFGQQRGTFSYNWHTTEMKRVPQILHVNRESRSLTLESYTLEFGLSNLPRGVYIPFPGRIYVNWERDTICPIGVNYFQDSWVPEIFEHPRIRNLALNVRELLNPNRELRSDGCLNIHSLFGLPNLEEVIFYYSDPSPQRADVDVAQGFCLEFEDLDESFIVKDLCRMPLRERPSLSYLLAARKTVYKDFDVLVQKRRMRDDLVRKEEKIPIEMEIKGIDRVLERKRPLVRLAYLTVNGRFAPSESMTVDDLQ